jgi:hypothetical protein
MGGLWWKNWHWDGLSPASIIPPTLYKYVFFSDVCNFSNWENLQTLIGPMSSQTRLLFSLYQVQCRARIDTLFYSVLSWFFLSSCCLVANFELWKLGIFWKMNLDQTVENHKHNLDSEVLNNTVKIRRLCVSRDSSLQFLNQVADFAGIFFHLHF